MSTKTKPDPKKAVKKSSPKKDKITDSKTETWVYTGPDKLPEEWAGAEKSYVEGTYEYDRDAILMTNAAAEIKNLREQNRHMSIRLEMFDKMYNLFTGNQGNTNGKGCCGSDLVSDLEYRAKERTEELKASSKTQS